jgi:hypothetical protein
MKLSPLYSKEYDLHAERKYSMRYKNYKAGMMVAVLFSMPIIYSADEDRSQRDLHERRRQQERDLLEQAKKRELSDNALEQRVNQQFKEKHPGEGLSIALGTGLVVGAICGVWSWLFGKKSETADKPESAESTDAAASAGSESQPSASPSDSPQS